jgi:hypothetical protein
VNRLLLRRAARILTANVVRCDIDIGEVLLSCRVLVKTFENRRADDVTNARFGNYAVLRVREHKQICPGVLTGNHHTVFNVYDVVVSTEDVSDGDNSFSANPAGEELERHKGRAADNRHTLEVRRADFLAVTY